MSRPADEMGKHVTVTVEVAFDGHRYKRESDEVADVARRWAVRWVQRKFAPHGYRAHSATANVYPGRTYIGWWFGSVEVDLSR